MPDNPSRRTLLALGAGAALAAWPGSSAQAADAEGRDASSAGGIRRSDNGVEARLRDLESQHSARLGVFARNTATGRTVVYRASELFPICSAHKVISVAALLRNLDAGGGLLAERITYTAKDTTDSGYAPVTGTPDHLAHGMTVGQLCAAAIEYSDNAASNLIVRQLGCPQAVTRFCRSIGDITTRLDRWEPTLNSAEPWRVTDTTSPAAVARTYARLVLGDVLSPTHRKLLTGWMLADTTSGNRFRAGLPRDWRMADKTGTGDYGTANDVGLAWTPDGTSVVLSVLSTKHDPKAQADEPLIAEVAAVLAAAVG
ncbi:class A beta-lactamase [Streptomyces sp. PTM05]|uniref:Beta-lactamase n=1 Tax=Streptantibioticus parmotrematis TaxID=2873249 RepID=A0ABS7QPQ4_9ACTN|nr:class A beta-lactamase [Streptantibioticus parmotrematis]MBY8885172.1 class A beta-lactamase [Streptantibioticus parmotrematis]